MKWGPTWKARAGYVNEPSDGVAWPPFFLRAILRLISLAEECEAAAAAMGAVGLSDVKGSQPTSVSPQSEEDRWRRGESTLMAP